MIGVKYYLEKNTWVALEVAKDWITSQCGILLISELSYERLQKKPAKHLAEVLHSWIKYSSKYKQTKTTAGRFHPNIRMRLLGESAYWAHWEVLLFYWEVLHTGHSKPSGLKFLDAAHLFQHLNSEHSEYMILNTNECVYGIIIAPRGY